MPVRSAVLVSSNENAPESGAREFEPQQRDDQEHPSLARLRTLKQRYSKMHKRWEEDERKRINRVVAKARREGKPVRPALKAARGGPPPVAAILPEFQRAAKDYSGTEKAVPFLVWIVVNGYVAKETLPDTKKAADVLTARHLASPRIGEFVGKLTVLRLAGIKSFAGKSSREVFARIEAENPVDNIRASAIFQRVRATLKTAKPASAEYAKARADAHRALGLTENAWKMHAKIGALLQRSTQPVGELAGVDLDGVPFKLSDYAGKIILLDFWGDW